MKISLNWLKDYIDIPDSPETLSEILTSLGLEVEGMTQVESMKGGLEGLVIGQVIECDKHPNADKLSLTKVDIGHAEPLQIVCGAPNVSKGQKVIVATIGTVLYPYDGESFQIKKGKIRGEDSEGMICAEDEIGLGSDHAGIIVLPENVEVGESAASYYKVESDIVYEIGLTPNRSDATSHLGVARDLAAYYSFHNGSAIEIRYPDLSVFSEGQQVTIEVNIADIEACPRYSGLSISSVEIGSSPQWMQNRLKAIDVRPINNIVDITNYVLHEYGQPLHAFDQDAINGNQVIVQKLKAGTIFLTLDGTERTLMDSDLMICDGQNHGMCIAGVFGGSKSGVKDHTTKIFLESAHFEAQGIRKTSTKHNLRTDAAKCYEKGSDPNITVTALKRAALLMQQYAGASIDSKLIDVYPHVINPITIEVKSSTVNRLIGANLSNEEIGKVLNSLGMSYSKTTEGVFQVSIPTDKADVTREVDVIEEILRIYGFNNVKVTNRISTAVNRSIRPDMPLIRKVLSHNLIGKGYNEMMGLSLIPSQLYDGPLKVWKEKMVLINNTSNIHLDGMRPEMILSVLQSVQYNHNRQQKNLRLFEFGSSYETSGDDFKETEYLTVVISGAEEKESWIAKQRPSDFYSLKRTVLELLESLGINKYQISDNEDIRFDYGIKYHKGDQLIVQFGKVASNIARLMEIKADIFFAEFQLGSILKSQKSNVVVTEDIAKFPSSRRDLALVIDENIRYGDLEVMIKKVGKKMITEINLFDVFKDEVALGKGKKSYAISMIFNDNEKNLKDGDIDKIIKQILHLAKESFGAVLR
jgi:phenylalanyl-tRNA synthetase beta chain